MPAVDVSQQRQSMSAAEAETRLRYVQDVRSRTRHTAVIPVLAVGLLGALIIVRGLLMRYWPHVAGIQAAWLLGTSAVVLVADRWQGRRQRMDTGVLLARGGPALLAIVIVGELVAHGIGTNVLIAGAAVPLAIAAWRTGVRMIAVRIAVIGAIGEVLVLQGMPQWAAVVIFGTGLVAVGLVWPRTPLPNA